MPTVSQTEIIQYIQAHIPDFHRGKLAKLKVPPLLKVLSRKNPYLLKAKGLVTPRDLVKANRKKQKENFEQPLTGFVTSLTPALVNRSLLGNVEVAF